MKNKKNILAVVAIIVTVILGGIIYLLLEKSTPEQLTIKGNKDFKLDAPIAITTNGTNLYITNSGNNEIIITDRSGDFIKKIGGTGTSPGKFNYPVDIDHDVTGNIFIADFRNSRVQIFDEDGNFKSVISKEGLMPAAIVSDDNGRLFISDVSTHQIHIYKDGQLEKSFGTQGSEDGQLNFANGLAITPNGQRLVVSDSQNKRLQVFTIDGNFMYTIPLKQAGLPKGISVEDDSIYLADSLVHKIYKISIDGKKSQTILQ
ncbi:MAG: repeat containing protein, partial [Bacillales bacterium]|nr:repeat containing protein [Bacillales bacterium]